LASLRNINQGERKQHDNRSDTFEQKFIDNQTWWHFIQKYRPTLKVKPIIDNFQLCLRESISAASVFPPKYASDLAMDEN
jgi:hypothetical protein